MIAHTAVYTKKDGSTRSIVFFRINDLPKDFIDSKFKGNPPRNLAEGYELVWDLEVRDFRMFNWKTVIGEVVKKDINFVL